MKVLPRGDRQTVEGVLQVLPRIDAKLLAGLGEAGQDRQGPAMYSMDFKTKIFGIRLAKDLWTKV